MGSRVLGLHGLFHSKSVTSPTSDIHELDSFKWFGLVKIKFQKFVEGAKIGESETSDSPSHPPQSNYLIWDMIWDMSFLFRCLLIQTSNSGVTGRRQTGL